MSRAHTLLTSRIPNHGIGLAVLAAMVFAGAARATDEICANGIDDDGDSSVDNSPCKPKEICCNGIDDDGNGRIDEGCGACIRASNEIGAGVNTASRQIQAGPYRLAYVASDLGGRADLDFEILYDSTRAKADDADETVASCSVNADCGDGRNCISGACSPNDTTELPYVRVLGAGFRHSYGDRLIIDGGQIVTWERMDRTVTFTPTGDGMTWQSEPGTHAIIQTDGDTWLLLDDKGDLLQFERPPSGPTALDPDLLDQAVSGAAAVYSEHLRLTKIFPGAAPNRFIRLLYEGDATGTGPEEVPTAVCSGMPAFGALPSGSCYADRGLLVKIGVVLDGGDHGPSFELQYYPQTAPSGAQLRNQYMLNKVVSGTDRVDGVTQQTLGEIVLVGVHPRRISYVSNRLHVVAGPTATQSRIAHFTFGSPIWELTEVNRPIVTSAGSAVLRPEQKFTWTSGNVSAATSLATSIASTTTPYSSTMTWTHNGESLSFGFDADHHATSCPDGSCGLDREWATTTDGYALGASAFLEVNDSVWRAFDYADPTDVTRGPVLVCELVATSSVWPPPSCTLTGDVATWDTATHPRRLERRYYDSLGRLRASAVYDVDDVLSTSGSVTFPHQTDLESDANPFVSGGSETYTLDGDCDTLTTSFTGGYFDVTTYDYDSDGDGDDYGLNEGVLSTGFLTAFPDMLLVRTQHAAQSSGDTTQRTSCTIYERGTDSNSNTGRGDVTIIRRYEDGSPVEYTDVSNVFPVTAGETSSNDRRASVIRYRDPYPDDPITTWEACSSGAYDEDGRAVCFDIPQDGTNPSISVVEVSGTQSSSDPFAYRRTTTISGGGTTATSYANYLAWGATFERGVGNDLSDAVPEGNFDRIVRDGTSGDATKALAVASTEHYDSTGTILWKTTNTRDAGKDPYGRVTSTATYNGTGAVLRSNQDRTLDTTGVGQDRASLVEDEIRASPFASAQTTLHFQSAAWNALLDKEEPDGDFEQYDYGTSGNEAGRLTAVERGATLAGVTSLQEFTHTQDGLLYENKNPKGPSPGVGTYSYDAFRRLTQEDRPSLGQTVRYGYFDGKVSERAVDDNAGTPRFDVVTGYDGLGRPLIVEDAMTSTTLRVYKWDEKGSSTYESASPPGKSYTLDSAFNRGHLAYVEDQEGATFYRYDAAGHVISVVRHDGPLSSFSASNLVPIDFDYNDTGTQELVSITYPSGMVATYTYGNDKERPTGLSTSVGGFSLSNATYEPSGALSGWYWQSSSANARTITRDLLGRTAEILDKYSSSTWSDVKYYTTYVGDGYDDDGDLLTERDVSSSYTWLIHGTTGNQSRSYSYESYKDVLKSWVDDGSAESTTFDSAGRRSTEKGGSYTYDSTNWERMLSRGGTSYPATLSYTWGTDDKGGLVHEVTWPSGTTTFGYGPEFETTTVTTSSGTYTSSYDAEKRRVELVGPTGVIQRFRYGEGRLPLEETLASGSLLWTLDNIFMGDEPVGQVSKLVSPNVGPTAFHLHTDRMGTVRKISSLSGGRLQRIISDAWASSNYSGTDKIVDSGASPNPLWNWRYPGQYVDAGGAYNNGWRDYLPELGAFNAPDPEHQQVCRESFGPNGFTYSGQRPLTEVDPDGRDFQSFYRMPNNRRTLNFSTTCNSNGGGTFAATMVYNLSPFATTTVRLCSNTLCSAESIPFAQTSWTWGAGSNPTFRATVRAPPRSRGYIVITCL